MRLGSHRIDARIRTAALGQLLDALVHILLHEIMCLGSGRLRHGEPFRDSVDRDDPARPKQESAADRELPDRSTTPNGDGVAVLDVAEVGRHVACWEYVR